MFDSSTYARTAAIKLSNPEEERILQRYIWTGYGLLFTLSNLDGSNIDLIHVNSFDYSSRHFNQNTSQLYPAAKVDGCAVIKYH